MSHVRIGEVLSKFTGMGPMDVEEILQDQTVTNRRFGEIAMSWGLCAPEDVWQAWYSQLDEESPRIDLDDLGIDSQAVAHVPREMAIQWNLIPLRIVVNQLVVAISDNAREAMPRELLSRLPMKVRCVRADARQIRRAIEMYYPELAVSA